MTETEARKKIETILHTADLQQDGEFIWNEDELVEKLLKLFKLRNLTNG